MMFLRFNELSNVTEFTGANIMCLLDYIEQKGKKA